MANIRKFENPIYDKHQGNLKSNNPANVLEALKYYFEHAKNKLVFLRTIQNDYPHIWEAIQKGAQTMQAGENSNFLTETRKLLDHQTGLNEIYTEFLMEDARQAVNVDSGVRARFINNFKSDEHEAKLAIQEMDVYLASMLVDNFTSKWANFSKAFTEAWPKAVKEYSSTNKKEM